MFLAGKYPRQPGCFIPSFRKSTYIFLGKQRCYPEIVLILLAFAMTILAFHSSLSLHLYTFENEKIDHVKIIDKMDESGNESTRSFVYKGLSTSQELS